MRGDEPAHLYNLPRKAGVFPSGIPPFVKGVYKKSMNETHQSDL
jgi:hypothetical protein